MEFILVLVDEQMTTLFGRELAKMIVPGDVLLLSGELGAGKTTLVKALVGELNGEVEVTSPTFALCHYYETTPPIAHVDCWRMESPNELADLALDELLEDGWVAIVEWGERLGDIYDDLALRLVIETIGTVRSVRISSTAPRWIAREKACNLVFSERFPGVKT
jgi:tRNA threonylcarbamoyl adenosine modification protein YjeE